MSAACLHVQDDASDTTRLLDRDGGIEREESDDTAATAGRIRGSSRGRHGESARQVQRPALVTAAVLVG